MDKKGFTLIEVLVVIIIFGVLVAMGLTRYNKVIEQTRERDACIKLISIHSANEIYKGRANRYLPGTNLDLAAINTGLGLNIISYDLVFDYDSASPYSSYQTTADFQRGGASVFKVRVNEEPLTAVFSALDPVFSQEDFLDTLLMQTIAEAQGCTPTNPCCDSGGCPTLADCC